MNVIELTGVSKTHTGSLASGGSRGSSHGASPVTALHSVTLGVSAGEFAAITGPSGSGKSTLLAIAGTLERPSAGTVRLAGQETDRLPDRELCAIRAAAIGFVFQQFHLVPWLTAVDNVATALLYRGMPAGRRRRAATDALADVGLAHRVGHRPAELSGGECQRVAIARAMVGQPAALLADEPTGSLDTAAGQGVLGILADLNSRGTTVIVVTHDPHVAALAGRVIRLRDGHVVADGGAA
ncbi:MAG TPA: ABC transporter ATP-binding protein [Streptosporangiaceae bacterium]|nr:ABC transporter ATP-binding protein [Streptosporangiaceae bacterium]